ncbi:MAG: SufE family protein [Bacteriovoracaceae bacterium]|jgi:cysteine desulfuration protein SufE|nr:SufE family protein [Bacteriovoracaceae bacterium]
MGKIVHIVERFLALDGWEARYKEVMKLGKDLESLSQEYQVEKYKIKGCQSSVWLVPALKEGKVIFKADSDAMLVKGIIALLVEAYSELTPDEILQTKSDFLKEIGITEHLSMNRSNGLASMVKQIQMYAMAYKTLTDNGVMNA